MDKFCADRPRGVLRKNASLRAAFPARTQKYRIRALLWATGCGIAA
jgi:hypothetical protein